VEATPSPITRVDELVIRWSRALRAAGDALAAGSASFTPEERVALSRRLRVELASTQDLLTEFSRERGSRRLVTLALSSREARRIVSLPSEVAACVFNLDGVLIGSADLHAEAWSTAFDEFLLNRAERTQGRFHLPLFNPRLDYPMHLHARPRLEGVREFLASRGIRLPDGGPGDPPGTETVHGLANHKNEVLRRLLDERGVPAFEGSRSYLELAHEAGVRCAVVSASANTPAMLEKTGLAELIDVRVDGTTMERDHLRVKPAPDTLLAACRLLEVEPHAAAAFETTRAGVAAGREAGFDLVVGVDGAMGADAGAAMRAEGADVVVHDIAELLERRAA
jgi:HAD superfamily hydrolase (TIGR01509 family)